MAKHESGTRELLASTLSVAVPMLIHEYKTGQRLLQTPRTDISQLIAEKGDQLMYRGPQTAEVFNALAEGIATLAFCPGGVTLFGLHFEDSLEETTEDTL